MAGIQGTRNARTAEGTDGSRSGSDYSNSRIGHIIDEYIHSDRDRDIMRSRLIDGWTYERIAEAYDMSDRQVKRIVYRCEDTVFRHLQQEGH